MLPQPRARSRPLYIILGVLVSVVLLGAGLIALARITSTSIDGISCDFSESVTYHVHARLTIVVRGHATYPPGGVGIHFEHLCLYWLHTHDASGIIHIEAPHRIRPTLRTFFDVWQEPLSRRVVWKYHVPIGDEMRIFVDSRPYGGDPGSIVLLNHTAVTLEIGPPFIPPPAPQFGALGL